ERAAQDHVEELHPATHPEHGEASLERALEEGPFEAGPLLLERPASGAKLVPVGARGDVEGASGDHHALGEVEQLLDRGAVGGDERKPSRLGHGVGVGAVELEVPALEIGREEDGGTGAHALALRARPASKALRSTRARASMEGARSAAEPTAAAWAPAAATSATFWREMPAMATTGTGEPEATTAKASSPFGG